jgi:glucose/arabinose dehydrogenase
MLKSLFSTLAAAGLLLAGSAAAQTALTTTRVASGLSSPVGVTHVPGDTNRLFILEQGSGGTARIKILNLGTGVVNATPYLTITGISTGGERGLLGLAFHPNYAQNGYFYVYVSANGSSNAVRRYQVSAGNPDLANVSTVTTLLTMSDPFSNHNGGWISFGPDGFLYVATGDGGSANDPNGAGQNNNQLLGKMLRINVDVDDFPADAARNYGIPAGNPFAGGGGSPEIWLTGLRNPWRNDFDNLTGDLYIGDVGQNAVEEISFAPAGVGGLNYGWRCMEGTSCTGLSGCTCNAPTLRLPIQTYSHSLGCSVTGGVMYRGSDICDLGGTYFYADYCTSRIWSFRYSGSGPVTGFQERTAQLDPPGTLAINSPTSFGEDARGEMYIVDYGGEVFKVVPASAPTDCNGNGIGDTCDLLAGTSVDTNGDGVLDECQTTVVSFCFGDGTATPCPCGNAGAAGNGCASSVNALGARLASSGVPSLTSDTFVLQGTGMANSSALYFQGTVRNNGGLGAVFGDGLRCASGSVIRLGTKVNAAGASSFPSLIDLPISFNVTGTGTRTYQVWYRNAAAFCTPSTFNLSNGLEAVWVP